MTTSKPQERDIIGTASKGERERENKNTCLCAARTAAARLAQEPHWRKNRYRPKASSIPRASGQEACALPTELCKPGIKGMPCKFWKKGGIYPNNNCCTQSIGKMQKKEQRELTQVHPLCGEATEKFEVLLRWVPFWRIQAAHGTKKGSSTRKKVKV